jgi:hypothetical protein
LAGQVLVSLPWYLGLLGRIAQYQSPLIAELTPGSTVLSDLDKDTRSALVSAPGASHLVARKVLWAGKEKVVINADFAVDPMATLMNDRDHFSVCKPRSMTDPSLLALVEEMIA